MLVDSLNMLPIHPAAELFPMMERDEKEGGNSKPGPLAQLAADMKANGCHTPVVIYEGEILDGRNRIAAALLVGIEELPTTEYEGSDPLSYVLSLNLHRRQLTKAQLVELAMRLMPAAKERAAERSGARTDLQEILPEGSAGQARDEVAKMLGGAISGKLIEQGIAVAEKAPSVWAEVQRGARSISDAYNTVKAPPAFVPQLDGEKLIDKADRAYESFIDVIDGLNKVGNDEQKARVARMIRNLLDYCG